MSLSGWLAELLGIQEVQDEGVASGAPITSANVLNFVGAGVTAAYNAVTRKIDVTINGGGAGGGAIVGWKDPVTVASTAALPAHTLLNGVLTASANGALLAIDNISLSVGESLLYWSDPANENEHGIYVVTQVGSGSLPWVLTRRDDARAAGDIVSGMRVAVSAGNTYGPVSSQGLLGAVFTQIASDPITIDSTNQIYTPDYQVTGGELGWKNGRTMSGSVTTTDAATTTNLATFTFTADGIYNIIAMVGSHQTGSANFAFRQVSRRYKRTSGVLTALAATTDDHPLEDSGASILTGVTLDEDGAGTGRLRVNGKAATTVRHAGVLERVQFLV